MRYVIVAKATQGSQADKIAQKQGGNEIVNIDKIRITDHIDFEQLKELRNQTSQNLDQARKLEKIFTSADGMQAQISKDGASKMVSDKALKKSIANGFTPQQHFQAVNDLENIFSKAKYTTQSTDEADPMLTIYRFNADLENMNVLFTLKEWSDKGRKIYALELENLQSVRFNPSGKDITDQALNSKDPRPANPKAENKTLASNDSSTKTTKQTPKELIKFLKSRLKESTNKQKFMPISKSKVLTELVKNTTDDELNLIRAEIQAEYERAKK